MKALEIHINGIQKCVAGTEADTVCAAINSADGKYVLSVFGKSDDSEETAFWLFEPLFADDEVTIRLVEVDSADPPIELD